VSLQTRLSSLITAIGADIKSLKNSKDAHAASVAAQTVAGNADTYLAGSSIAIPQGKIQAQTIYRCKFNVVKTAAGVQAPTIGIKVGTAGTAADTTRATLTFAAQTAVIDEGWFEVECTFRQAGATAIIQAVGNLLHRLITTGLNVTGLFTSVLNTGAQFDVTGANLKIGAVVNPGASASWTVSLVSADLVNLAP
jgi:hypothetical protein